MPPLNQLIRDRRSVIRKLKQHLKQVDTALEVSERFLEQIMRRKSKVPEEADLAKLADQAKVLADLLQVYLTLLREGYIL